MTKQQRYNIALRTLGMKQIRLWIPEGMEATYTAQAAADRIDYLHAVAEDAPDLDLRLYTLADMNKATALTVEQKASLRAKATHGHKIEAALADLDACEAAMLDAIKEGQKAEAENRTAEAVRNFARATVAGMDYRRQRDALIGRT